MKRIRKFLIRSFALAMLAMLVVGGVLGGFGYKMYRDALAEQPLEEKVAEIRADPDYTPLLKSQRFIWTSLWQWKITVLNSILELT